MSDSLQQREARLGEPSYVWRAGQERRLQMILSAAEGRQRGWVLDNGCGLGLYLQRLAAPAERAFRLGRGRGAGRAAEGPGPPAAFHAQSRVPFRDPWGLLSRALSVRQHPTGELPAAPPAQPARPPRAGLLRPRPSAPDPRAAAAGGGAHDRLP